jgi:C1A family cysteine protease
MNPQSPGSSGIVAAQRLRCPPSLVALCLAFGVFACSCADLVVRNVRHEPLPGPNLVMKATIANQGSRAAGASTAELSTRYALSGPFTQVSRTPTPPLDRGQQVDVPVWVFPPTALPEPGQCLQAQVCADVDDVVQESSNANNCLTQSFANTRYCRSCDLCCNETLPLAFDWRSRQGTNWVTGVRDQANCGSCWAFSAVAAVEAKNNVERDASQQSPIDLSEQELVSCAGGGGSCLGGWPGSSMGYIQAIGIVDEATLPYTSTNCVTGSWPNLTCLAACTSTTLPGCATPLLTAAQCAALDDPAVPGGANPPMWRIGSSHTVNGQSVDDVKRALLCHGPLSVVSSNWGHAILLVGWNWTSWIIKNSWGANWGTNGYGTIPFTGHHYSDIVEHALYAQEVTRWP